MSAAAILSATLLLAGGPAPHPVSTSKDLGPALEACFRPPPDSAGSEVTVRFSLTRDGRVFGRPAVTYSKLAGTDEQKRAFVAAALSGLAACTPLNLAPGFGDAIAGRPLSVRLVGSAPARGI